MNNFMKRGLVFSWLFIIGCTPLTTDPRPAFDQVHKNVAQRTGHLIQWKTNTDEDEAVRQKINKMLQSKLTADRALQIALLNNPRIQGSYERLGIAQAQLVQAGLLKNPVFDLSLRFVEGPSSDYIIEMGVAKDFLDLLLVGIRKDLARAQLEITKSRVVGEVMNLAARTQIAFYSYQAALQTYETNKQITKAAELAYDAAQRLHKAGNITDLALATERSLYEQNKLERAASHTIMLQQREQLNSLMGLWAKNTDWQTVALLPDLPERQKDLTNLESRVIGNSLDLKTARRRMNVTAAKMGIDTAEMVFPETAAGAEAEREADGKWSVGPAIGVAIPFFDFGQAATAAARARLRRLWDDYTALAIEIRSAARSSKYRLVNARQQVDYYEQVIVPLAEQIALETQIQYNAMQLGVFQLLQAKKMEFTLRRNYIDALRNYWIARTELELLLDGHLTRKSLVRISSGPEIMMNSGAH
jgi:cobalt-zinc-cadmium efflux system outer membrane protein